MQPFSIPIRVYYEDTDAGGVVYYANYLKYMERARTEWLRQLGFEQRVLAQADGIVFAVRSATLEFLKPARFDDLLWATLRISERGGASLGFEQSLTRDEVTLCQGTVRIACLDANEFVPRPIPARIRERLEMYA